ncbi:MAG: undecaprenyldiphospho-muramoylpentapeptide beta-N-acetylglucosaminyltransferase [Candidatus Velthaea sp.]
MTATDRAPFQLRVAFAGGGTGGHIYPALGIDDALRGEYAAEAYEPRFFGNKGGLERKLVTTMPLSFVPSAPLQRKLSLGTVRTALMNLAGVCVALGALARFKPRMVIATGGYVCFPVVVAARILRALRIVNARIALLEINVQPGLTNRLLAPLVDEVWTTYADSGRFFGRKAHVTGTPTRASLARRSLAALAREALELDPAGTTIVAMGGSQGARSINEAVAALVTRRSLPDRWQVVHISGERDFEYMRAEERQLAEGNVALLIPYLDDPANAYAAADIIIARAGASTLAELAVTGTPSVLIPYPFAADGHQAANAAMFERAGAAVVVTDSELDGDKLWWTLRECLEPARLAAMKAAAAALAPPDAAAAIVRRIEALVPARVPDSGEPNEVGRD